MIVNEGFTQKVGAGLPTETQSLYQAGKKGMIAGVECVWKGEY